LLDGLKKWQNRVKIRNYQKNMEGVNKENHWEGKAGYQEASIFP